MKRTSRNIQRKIERLRAITAHYSPYANGLAPETRRFVEALNEEAKRLHTGVRYIALANRIEAKGAIETAARSKTTLGGWFLRQAIDNGYLEGEGAVLRRGNSFWRKQLRRRAKTKTGRKEKALIEAAMRDRISFRDAVEAAERKFGDGGILPSNWPRRWINGVYSPAMPRRRNAPKGRPTSPGVRQ
jgi:hypothetical protein